MVSERQIQDQIADWRDAPVESLAAVMPRHPTVCMAVRKVALMPEPDPGQVVRQGGLEFCERCRGSRLHVDRTKTYLVATCTNCNYSHVRLSR
jgi:hypothetical protein